MLTMFQAQNIRFLRNFKGLSLRTVARETGHHFETVQKYAEKEDFNLQLREKQHRKGKLEPFKELIDQWLKDDLSAKPKQRHTAKRIFDRLKELHGDAFNVSDRSVREYVARRRPEIHGAGGGHIPLEHSPGEAQVDFGAAQFYERGTLYDGHYLVLSFPHSNAGYMQIFKSENQECLLEGLKTIFEHVGGSPREIWCDNASTIVNVIFEFLVIPFSCLRHLSRPPQEYFISLLCVRQIGYGSDLKNFTGVSFFLTNMYGKRKSDKKFALNKIQ